MAIVALALLVGLGRMYTGANYPSDVLAGWALGGLWASVCLTAAEVFCGCGKKKAARMTDRSCTSVSLSGSFSSC